VSRTAWTWLRWAGCAATLAVLVWRLGTGPFLDGVQTLDARALLAAASLAIVTTACCAWRWKLVARALGVDLPLRLAVAAYYRSLFLNVTLPGGVLGDVHRGVKLGLRPVVWERFIGQVVQAALTVAILLALPSPVRSVMPLALLGLAAGALVLLLVVRAWPGGVRLHLPWTAWLGVTVASALVIAGHTLTFLIAARTAGVDASLARLLPLALLVMLAAVLPSVAGWGPREGATAWAFAAAGIGAEQGVATAVVYGVMVLFASLPGAAVLVVAWVRRPRFDGRVEHA
jgi:glycosyltransferase 2 family protein